MTVYRFSEDALKIAIASINAVDLGGLISPFASDRKQAVDEVLAKFKAIGRSRTFDTNTRLKVTTFPDGRKTEERYSIPFNEWMIERCPYGRIGDRLWVRERMQVVEWHESPDCTTARLGFVTVQYEADGAISKPIAYPQRLATPKVGKCLAYGGPRVCSRLTLENTGVRVELLQGISEGDAIAEGFTADTCAEFLDKAAGRVQMEDDSYWVEDDQRKDVNDGYLCHACARKLAAKGKGRHVCCGCTPESDGPAYCDKCSTPLCMSLSAYGIDRELFLECNDPSDRPSFAAAGMDARIAWMIASGYGDLQDRQRGRLAQIGFATAIDQINGKGSWAENPWVWVVAFNRVEVSRG